MKKIYIFLFLIFFPFIVLATVNYVVKIPDANFIITDTGIVGINNLNPAYNLDVNGNINFTGNLTKYGSSPFFWNESGTNIYYSSGNVGIGTASPGTRLDIVGSGITSSTASLNVMNASSTSALYVRNDGKVGIGTTGPGTSLHILTNDGYAGLTLQGAAAPTLRIYQTSGADFRLQATATAGYIGMMGTKDFNFVIDFGGTYHGLMVQGSTGNVGIGTTSPTTKLYVSGDEYVTGDVSALTFTDRTPGFTGDALTALKQIQIDSNGNLNDSSLPLFAQSIIKEQILISESKCLDENFDKTAGFECQNLEPAQFRTKTTIGRSLGAMISILTEAIKQLETRINNCEIRLDSLSK